MSIQLKLRGGTTAEHSSFTGSAREVTVDTTKKTLVVHDGSTAGGTPLLTAATDSTVIPSVTTTPTSGGSVGETVFNTTDNQLYRHNGTGYEIYAGVSGTVNTSAPAVTGLAEGSFYFNTTNNTLYILKDVSGTMTWTQVVPSVTASGNGIEVLAALPTSGNTEGRMVFLTSDDKLYRYDGTNFIATIATSDLTGYISAAQINANTITASHITANAVTAGKILAGEIGTSHLAANSITAGTIATNAITSGKIQANAIGAGHIAAGVISTVHLGANSILAGAITAGSLSMQKMTSTSELVTNGVTVQLGVGSKVGGNTAGGAYDSGNLNKYGLLAVNSAAGYAIGCGTTATSGDYAGCIGVGAGFSIGGEEFKGWKTMGWVGGAEAGVAAVAGPGDTVNGGTGTETARIQLAKGAYAYYITTGSNSPFTGAHDTLIPNGTQIEQGDIVIDESTAAKKSVSDTIAISVPSTTERQKGALGVFVQYSGPDHIPASLSMMIDGDGLTQKSILNPSYQGLMNENQVAVINSLGEGQINCCGEGGNLEIGDLIVTSSIPGKGMRQADDIVRSMTVAKVREDVTFANGEVKMVACIYLCG